MRLKLACLAGIAAVLTSYPAAASFQFIPPSDPAPAAPVPAAPVPVAPVPAAPVPAAPAPLAAPPPAPLAPAPMAPAPMAPAPMAPAPMTPTIPASEMTEPTPLAAPPPAGAPVVPAPMAPGLDAPMAPADIVEGFGTEVPLVIALRQIVPSGLQVAFGDAVDLGSPVTWQGGMSWRTVLVNTISPLGLVASQTGDVVFVQRNIPGVEVANVIVADPLPPPPTATAPAPIAPMPLADAAAGIGLPPLPEMPDMPMVELEPMFDPDTGPWLVEQGRTLKQVLQDWSETAEWTMVWNSERDYVMQSSTEFAGDFPTAASELLRVFADADPSVAATFYRNRTLVVQTEALVDNQ